ncbi:MAG: ribulose-phosphate 3-epimerase [Streptococcaceae bacterium]|nr:ribulose-phosphate 3-epimerase [Streptococcaceae bacterium]
MKIAPSILSADFANLERDVKLVEELGADYIHIDIMDGQFVPNITMGPNVVAALRSKTKLTLDVHMMVDLPERFIEDFANAGSDIITIHQEATPHLHGALQKIKNTGTKAGVVINPGTSVETIKNVLHLVDQVLIMTVNPGFGGQSFLPECLEKVKELVRLREKMNLDFDIEVDGGVDDMTIGLCKQAGANVFVAGSYVYGAKSPKESMNKLQAAVN